MACLNLEGIVMLVLSRRHKEKIVFPNLGITVEVLKTNGRVAQLGIKAPKEVAILRGEVADRQSFTPAESDEAASRREHELRNRLNSLGLTLEVLQRRVHRGERDGIESMLNQAIKELQSLDSGARSVARTDIDLPHSNRDVQADRPQKSALLVDDSVNERTLLAELLDLSGFDVFAVPDGREALRFLRSGRQFPNFVLLDMCMPNMDGVETVTEIRSDPALVEAGFKLFAVSGADRNDLQISIGPNGVDRWFSKPVDAKVLISEMTSELQIV
jgi:carbon storage regulator CsrA